MSKKKIGPTGDYPRGKISEDDEGGLQMAVGHDLEKRVVFLDFGAPVNWVAFTGEEAMTVARNIFSHAERLMSCQKERETVWSCPDCERYLDFEPVSENPCPKCGGYYGGPKGFRVWNQER